MLARHLAKGEVTAARDLFRLKVWPNLFGWVDAQQQQQAAGHMAGARRRSVVAWMGI